MKYLFIILAFLSITPPLHSQYVIIKGQIFDEITQKPIPQSHIYSDNKTIGTVSNQVGEFLLKVPSNLAGQSINVSHIGYENYTLIIPQQSTKTTLKIFLIPAVYQLDDFALKSLYPKSIIKKVIDRLPENYHTEAMAQDLYYRSISKESKGKYRLEEHGDFVEAALKSYKAPYIPWESKKRTNPYQFKALKGRMKDFSDDYFQKRHSSTSNALGVNIISQAFSTKRYTFLDKKYLKYYDFSLDSLTKIAGNTVYAFSFKHLKKKKRIKISFPKIKKVTYKDFFFDGNLYIDTSSLAIVEAHIFYESLHKYYSRFSDAQTHLEFKYYPRNKKWFLYYLRDNHQVLSYPKKQANFFETRISDKEVVITAANTKNPQAIPDEDIINYENLNRFFTAMNVKSEDFWEDKITMLSSDFTQLLGLDYTKLPQNKVTEILLKAKEQHQSIQNGKYQIQLEEHIWGREKTEKFQATCTFEKDPIIQFGAYFKIEADKEYTLYTGKDVYDLDTRESKIIAKNLYTDYAFLKEIYDNDFVFKPFIRNDLFFINILKITQYFNAELLDEQKVGEALCHQIKLTLPDEEEDKNRSMTLFIDKETFFVLKVVTESNFEEFDNFFAWEILSYAFNKEEFTNIYSAEGLPKQYTVEKFDPRYRKQEDEEATLPLSIQVPDFEAKNLKGEVVKLSDFKGKVVLIDFWYRTCYFCIKSSPSLKNLYEKYQDKLLVLGLNTVDKEESLIKDFIERREINYPILIGDSKIADNYKVNGYPTFFLIDQEGKLQKVISGYGEDLEELIISELDKLGIK